VNEAANSRVSLAIMCGVCCLIIGLTQFLYSFLAFASVIFVDLLGIGLTLATSALAAVPDKPYEIPYARSLANTIAVIGMLFAVVAFVTGCRSFYRRRISRIGLTVCAAICTVLAALHWMNSLSFPTFVYVGAIACFCCLLLADWATNRETYEGNQRDASGQIIADVLPLPRDP
jgi:cellulose synthase/poly-beta-1,6-N-acetylglucosamine synthase-like glycosyltransferase